MKRQKYDIFPESYTVMHNTEEACIVYIYVYLNTHKDDS
jgi:hypothetical protein